MKQTPFSLFIRQALQQFSGNSFLPQESDVKNGVSYAFKSLASNLLLSFT